VSTPLLNSLNTTLAGSISNLSLTLNTPLPPIDNQSNDRDQQSRRFLAAESVEEVLNNNLAFLFSFYLY